MPFVIRHKKTGELYTGDNIRAVKYYSTRGAASGAISNSVVSGRRAMQMIGIDWHELHDRAEEGVVPTLAEIENAEEDYRRAQYDYKGDSEKIKPFREMLYDLRYDRDAAITKNRRRIINELSKWEVVEV